MSPKGAFIVFEGIDGSGTSTQAARLASRLRASGRPAHLTHEPSDGPIGVLIRQALRRRFVVPTADGSRAPGMETMALLFAADRMDHLESEIVPRLERGEIVLCDRYLYSSLAYQSATGSRGGEAGAADEAIEWLLELNRYALAPDLVLLFDLPAGEAGRRRVIRGGDEELFEEDSLQARIAAAYAAIPERLPEVPFESVDASRSVDEVEAEILAILERRGLDFGLA